MKLEDKVLERIDTLGGKLDNISQHAWESLVKYQVMEGVTGLILGVVLIALTIILWKVFFNHHKKVYNEDARSVLFEYDKEISILGAVFVLALSLLTLTAGIYLVVEVPTDIMKIISPEIFAVKDLIAQAKGGS